jgi:hypothetical protein
MNSIAANAYSTRSARQNGLKKWAAITALALLAMLGVGQALAASSPPFVDNGDGTVTDSSTGLMWDQCAAGLSGNGTCRTGTAATYTWADAFGLATTQSAAKYKGYSDWRLPSAVELMTLVKGAIGPFIDTAAFPSTPADEYFWTSSTYAPVPSFAWFVGFDDGNAIAYDKTSTFFVRLVRSGQSLGSFGVFPVGVTGISTLRAASPTISMLRITASCTNVLHSQASLSMPAT